MLRIRNLKCYYGRIMAVKGVSLSVKHGQIIALIGANGSGKSTLLESICGLLPDWKGDITFEGIPLKGLDPPAVVKLGISLVPEGRLVFPPISVLDNLKLGAYTMYRKRRHGEVSRTLEKILDLFPILKQRAKQPAGTLSGGEQQMLAIGRALMSHPKLLLLDEPSMGLAPLIVEKFFTPWKHFGMRALPSFWWNRMPRLLSRLRISAMFLKPEISFFKGPPPNSWKIRKSNAPIWAKIMENFMMTADNFTCMNSDEKTSSSWSGCRVH